MMGLMILGCVFAIFAFIFLVLLKVYAVLTMGKCHSTRKLHGKTALVTGSNRGIGYMTALDLAKRGARVIITSENKEAIIEARDKIISITGNRNIVAKHLDLRSLQNVRDFAKDILDTEDRLDILVNNAGTVGQGTTLTKDGILPDMQVNCLGPFLLTNLILLCTYVCIFHIHPYGKRPFDDDSLFFKALMKKSTTSRIVNVASSFAQIPFGFNPNNINYCITMKGTLCAILIYCSSKLCVALITMEMAKKLQGTGITVNCLHPGVVYTKIFDANPNGWIAKFVHMIAPIYFKTPEQGAETSIHLSVCDSVEGVTGKYFSDCRESNLWANKSPEIIKHIWDQSVALVNLSKNEMYYD